MSNAETTNTDTRPQQPAQAGPAEVTNYDHLFDPAEVEADTLGVAVAIPDEDARNIRIKALQQMGVARADRANRQAAGLAPRVFDLR